MKKEKEKTILYTRPPEVKNIIKVIKAQKQALPPEDFNASLVAIKLYYQNNVRFPLTVQDDELRERWESIYDMYVQDNDPDNNTKFDRQATLNRHIHKYPNVSRTLAQNDLKFALKLFGDVNAMDKATARNLAVQMSLELYRDARKSGELNIASVAIKNFITASGVDRDDPNVPNMEELKTPVVEVLDEVSRALLARIATIAQSGNVLDLTELKVIDLIEGIDFQVIERLNESNLQAQIKK